MTSPARKLQVGDRIINRITGRSATIVKIEGKQYYYMPDVQEEEGEE